MDLYPIGNILGVGDGTFESAQETFFFDNILFDVN